ncbi:MAG: cytochrome P450 [Pseudohongiellaceae bacterium]
MADAAAATRRQSERSMVGRDPWTMPLEEIDLAHPGIWEAGEYLPFLARLRRDAPVHYCASSAVGPYWSVTRYHDIMAVEADTATFSSEPTIGIVDVIPEYTLPMFIAMDPPRHDEQRKVVQGAVAPANLKNLEGLIRERVSAILDDLPLDSSFNWVDRVSRELTTQMLATLFGFPFEERHKLPYWSDVATAIPGAGVIDSYEEGYQILQECLAYFSRLWRERAARPPGDDLISMLAHGEATRNLSPREFLGNLVLLIVGGNDTTRNSISGGVLALNEFPEEYRKLRDNPALIPGMVSEIVRWQTPLAYMRRTATRDTELGGERIRKGDKVVLWYASANRDERAVEEPDRFIIDRPRVRQHLSFGTGIHRCMGNRLAEMQLRILWEEILQRFHTVEVTGNPVRIYSSFVKGYSELPVRVHPR